VSEGHGRTGRSRSPNLPRLLRISANKIYADGKTSDDRDSTDRVVGIRREVEEAKAVIKDRCALKCAGFTEGGLCRMKMSDQFAARVSLIPVKDRAAPTGGPWVHGESSSGTDVSSNQLEKKPPPSSEHRSGAGSKKSSRESCYSYGDDLTHRRKGCRYRLGRGVFAVIELQFAKAAVVRRITAASARAD